MQWRRRVKSMRAYTHAPGVAPPGAPGGGSAQRPQPRSTRLRRTCPCVLAGAIGSKAPRTPAAQRANGVGRGGARAEHIRNKRCAIRTSQSKNAWRGPLLSVGRVRRACCWTDTSSGCFLIAPTHASSAPASTARLCGGHTQPECHHHCESQTLRPPVQSFLLRLVTSRLRHESVHPHVVFRPLASPPF